MVVISQLARAFGILKDTPAILAIAFGYAILASVGSALGMLENPLASILGTAWNLGISAFVLPFFLGGMIALANRGLEGGGRPGDFLADGKDNYLYLLGFTWVVGTVQFVWTIAVVFVAYVVLAVVGIGLFVGVVSLEGAAATAAGVLAIGLVLVLLVLIYLVSALPTLVVQFVPGAYVIDDMSPVEGAKRGLRLLADNLLRVVGFDLVVLGLFVLLFALTYVPAAAVGVVQGPEAVLELPAAESLASQGGQAGTPGGSANASVGFTPLGMALVLVPSIVLSTVQFGVVLSFYTAFYRAIAPENRTIGSEGGDTVDGEWKDVKGADA